MKKLTLDEAVKLRNIKVKFSNSEQCRRFQEAAFKAGCYWQMNRKTIEYDAAIGITIEPSGQLMYVNYDFHLVEMEEVELIDEPIYLPIGTDVSVVNVKYISYLSDLNVGDLGKIVEINPSDKDGLIYTIKFKNKNLSLNSDLSYDNYIQLKVEKYFNSYQELMTYLVIDGNKVERDGIVVYFKDDDIYSPFKSFTHTMLDELGWKRYIEPKEWYEIDNNFTLCWVGDCEIELGEKRHLAIVKYENNNFITKDDYEWFRAIPVKPDELKEFVLN